MTGLSLRTCCQQFLEIDTKVRSTCTCIGSCSCSWRKLLHGGIKRICTEVVIMPAHRTMYSCWQFLRLCSQGQGWGVGVWGWGLGLGSQGEAKKTSMDWSRFETRGLLHEIIEGRMKGKQTRGRRRIQMLHDLANDGCFVALKRAAENREGWRHRESMSETCCTAEDYWWWWVKERDKDVVGATTIWFTYQHFTYLFTFLLLMDIPVCSLISAICHRLHWWLLSSNTVSPVLKINGFMWPWILTILSENLDISYKYEGGTSWT